MHNLFLMDTSETSSRSFVSVADTLLKIAGKQGKQDSFERQDGRLCTLDPLCCARRQCTVDNCHSKDLSVPVLSQTIPGFFERKKKTEERKRERAGGGGGGGEEKRKEKSTVAHASMHALPRTHTVTL